MIRLLTVPLDEVYVLLALPQLFVVAFYSRNWFATAGGRDNTIKVWDLNKTSPTTVYSLRTKNTGNIRWRVGEVSLP